MEEALIDVAAEAVDELAAVAYLADAVQARSTTPARLSAALAGRARIARREFLAGALSDVEQGTGSVLEHGYLTRVERPHGLPAPVRQLRFVHSDEQVGFHDVAYRAFGLVVELDGRLFHTDALARAGDLERDLDVALLGERTVRLGWGQVFERPCQTAHRIGTLLRLGGWSGQITACPDCAQSDTDAALAG